MGSRRDQDTSTLEILDYLAAVRTQQPTPATEELVAEAIDHLNALLVLTDWDEPTLLQAVGCQLDRHRDLPPERLEACATFLWWLRQICEDLDLETDRRRSVRGLRQLLKDANGVQAAQEALDYVPEQSGSAAFSGRTVLRLGEIGLAIELARRQLATPAGDEARAVAARNPMLDPLAPVHLSPARVELVEGGMIESLGERVADRMRDHIERCSTCHREYGS